ncbi:cation efflux protein, partial [Kipferlia bialata]|eukprot:g13619.t1
MEEGAGRAHVHGTEAEAERPTGPTGERDGESSILDEAHVVIVEGEIESIQHSQPSDKKSKKPHASSGHGHHDIAMHGMFLHIMVAAIISALFIIYTDFSWRLYVDPICTLLVVVLVLLNAVPLVLEASQLLMQGIPQSLDMEDLKTELKLLP